MPTCGVLVAIAHAKHAKGKGSYHTPSKMECYITKFAVFATTAHTRANISAAQ